MHECRDSLGQQDRRSNQDRCAAEAPAVAVALRVPVDLGVICGGEELFEQEVVIVEREATTWRPGPINVAFVEIVQS